MVALYSPVTPLARLGGAPQSIGLPEEQEVTGVNNSCIIDMQQLAIVECVEAATITEGCKLQVLNRALT